ncbi:glucan biosynthesis protein [Phycisphaera mikurensis]|uniref:Glucans biosynthesis protein G n=1 Tax=Phycisphaera mikurensis (strain NBRC 102666 / KCTC 22515 / FYK2301M01) TaxID=1142394 RepID=I0IFX3_PHYMF|nr:glucan biosynthesis protein [Phycisphaera mikurensis]MBB6440452.1 glucans biosynthesis protein [Phycisphaera mikurensis]BAM04161.1 glucans biosynthesis protein G [Phycisphaera mikurensis NBRC 102666]
MLQRFLPLLLVPLLLVSPAPADAQSASAEEDRPDVPAPDPTAENDPFFERVFAEAEALAASPYEKPGPPVPPALKALPDHATKLITFKPQNSLWSEPGLAFRARLFHRGSWFNAPVQIFELENGEPRLIAYDAEDFDMRGVDLDPTGFPDDLGYAGASFYFRSADMASFEEKLSFLGASYFRAVSDGHHWGSSGRGLSINTAESAYPEEFPDFTKFWLVKPTPQDREMTVYALLNGESVTGAYRFDVSSDRFTVVRIRASLVFRRDVEKPGFAPLTSMFLMGEEEPGRFGDWRPEVHDADGLLMMTRGGESIWRPLDNPGRDPSGSRISRYAMEDPRGFGLIQRDREFDHYQDLDLRYHLRPSVWVQAGDDWGAGSVELVEFHSGDEDFDNLAAYWVPDDKSRFSPGLRFDIHYALWFCDDHPPVPSGGRFVDTKRGLPNALFPKKINPGALRFVLEARGGGLDDVHAGVPEAVLSADGGEILGEPVVVRNDPGGTWRVSFDVRKVGDEEPLTMRCYLRRGEDALTETWIYRWDGGTP